MFESNHLELVPISLGLINQHIVSAISHLGGSAQNPREGLARRSHHRVRDIISAQNVVVGFIWDGSAEGDSKSPRVGGGVNLLGLSISFRKGPIGRSNVSHSHCFVICWKFQQNKKAKR